MIAGIRVFTLACLAVIAAFQGFALGQTPGAPQVEVTGRVLDVTTHEPLRKALVSIRALNLETLTDDQGRFRLPRVPVGDNEFYFSTVGYGLLKRKIAISERGAELEILLGQEAIREENVTVSTGVFEPLEANTPSEHTLNNTELKNLADVLLNDPLRSVHTLPGVTSSDDYYAQFAARGSGFRNMGFYIDTTLTDQVFHALPDVQDAGNLSILNGDVIESISLLTSAAPAKYGDRTGSVLNVLTRDGSRERFVGRASLAFTGVSLSGEGPIGGSKKFSVLGAVRQSYLDWLIQKLTDDATTGAAFGFKDAFIKLTYVPSDRHQFSATFIPGTSGVNRERERQYLGADELLSLSMRTNIAYGAWRWIGSRGLARTQASYSKGAGESRNVGRELLFSGTVEEVALRTDTTFRLSRSHSIDVGWLVRRHFENENRRLAFFYTLFPYDQFRAAGWQQGFYAQDTWNPRAGVTLTVGGRFDTFSRTGERAALPRASLTLQLFPNTTLAAGYGQYAQFPDFRSLYGGYGWPSLQSERSTHYALSIEQRLTDKIRLRVELYDKEERNGIFSADAEARMVAGELILPFPAPVLRNTLRGYSRGVEIYLQRRSANRLSGWFSYALGHARFQDEQTGLAFDGDFDQRHTVNAYGSYRITKSLNLSAKYRYGSNYPVAGFFAWEDYDLVLASEKNRVRLPQYSRLDVRVNRAFHFDRWKLTMYAEVTNILRRENERFANLRDVDTDGTVYFFRELLLPFLPSAGMSIEF
jgi:outer membrane cobalamin receptor